MPIYREGFVRLVRVTPDLCPLGRSPEFAIVQSARVSFGNGLKSLPEDEKLIAYLIKNHHTSPLESVQFSFHLRVPMFVAIHLLRHRTAKLNMFSQRYAEIKDDQFFRPSQEKEGLRTQDLKNKQSSSAAKEGSSQLMISALAKDTEALLEKVVKNYHGLIKLGVAKEVARFCLPMATYTELYYTLDLNNFLKFISLRNDPHSQHETQICAKGMLDLVRPLIPTVLKAKGWHEPEAKLQSC